METVTIGDVEAEGEGADRVTDGDNVRGIVGEEEGEGADTVRVRVSLSVAAVKGTDAESVMSIEFVFGSSADGVGISGGLALWGSDCDAVPEPVGGGGSDSEGVFGGITVCERLSDASENDTVVV